MAERATIGARKLAIKRRASSCTPKRSGSGRAEPRRQRRAPRPHTTRRAPPLRPPRAVGSPPDPEDSASSARARRKLGRRIPTHSANRLASYQLRLAAGAPSAGLRPALDVARIHQLKDRVGDGRRTSPQGPLVAGRRRPSTNGAGDGRGGSRRGGERSGRGWGWRRRGSARRWSPRARLASAARSTRWASRSHQRPKPSVVPLTKACTTGKSACAESAATGRRGRGARAAPPSRTSTASKESSSSSAAVTSWP
jgi:hypothetical protein